MKKLTRNPDDKWIAGVCGGIAEYTGIDANVVRLVVAICTILGAGSLILGYIVAWILIPKPPRGIVWVQPTDATATDRGPAQQ